MHVKQSQLWTDMDTGRNVTIKTMEKDGAKGSVQTRETYKNGIEIRQLMNNMTGVASFKERKIIAEQLGGRSVDAKQPHCLNRLNKHIYSPAPTKIDGYGQFPRPKDQPYINKMNMTSEVSMREYLPK